MIRSHLHTLLLRLSIIVSVLAAPVLGQSVADTVAEAARPNFLFIITDDQSYWHTSFAGDPVVKTPGFDRIARGGVHFTNAYVGVPSCSPSRASILLGRNFYELGSGSVLFSAFPGPESEHPTFQDLLREQGGYFTGYTGKGWAPGFWAPGGREVDPVGLRYQDYRLDDTPPELSNLDYARNFKAFLDGRPDGAPFSFWFGSYEPHLPYARGRGEAMGLNPDDVHVPPFMPDTPGTRAQFLDYYDEIQWMDAHVVRMLDHLESIGELENTLIIITSDNGMPKPRAKSNLYDAGTRMPFAAMWKARVPAGREVTDFVNLADVAPTLLELAGVDIPAQMSARSFGNVLLSDKSGRVDPTRDAVVTGIERHDSPLPARAIRTDEFLLIRNYHTWRIPPTSPMWQTGEVDEAAADRIIADRYPQPLLRTLASHPRLRWYALQSFGPRPEWELYDVREDPWQMRNLAEHPALAEVRRTLADRLKSYLRQTGDPRLAGQAESFRQYPHYGRDWVAEDPEEREPVVQGWWQHQNESNQRLQQHYAEQGRR